MHKLLADRRQLMMSGSALIVTGTVMSVLPHQAKSENSSMPSHTIEIVSFKLVKGADDANFLIAVEATNTFLKTQNGFVARRMSRDESGTYIDHVEWASLEDAKAALEKSMQQADLLPFIQMIEPTSMNMQHNALLVSLG
jgi:hypothetical protein